MAVGKRAKRDARFIRTNVVLDDELVREAMKLTGIKTKRGVLAEALRTLVELRKQERIWDLYGAIEWDGDLADMRRGRSPDGDR